VPITKLFPINKFCSLLEMFSSRSFFLLNYNIKTKITANS